MFLQVFLLYLIPAYAYDFLTLVIDADRIPQNGEFTCNKEGSFFGRIPLRVQDEVPAYRVSADCPTYEYRFGVMAPSFTGRSAIIEGVLLYVCMPDHDRAESADEICGFHNKGTTKSLHVVYKGAKINEKVVFGKGQDIEFGFSDIYGGNTMSYGNFVGVLGPFLYEDDHWNLAVGNKEDSYTLDSITSSPGENQEVIGDKTLLSYFYPLVPADSAAPDNAFILSVGVFGTLDSHHLVHSCVKKTPHGHCVHSKAKTFTEGGSDMVVMALPNDMGTYYFEYTVSKLSSAAGVVSYDRIIFMTSVVDDDMVDSYQRRVVLSSELSSGVFVAGNLGRCNGDYKTCMKEDKKSFKLTFLGYTTTQQVQKLKVHGGEITVVVVDGDCVETTSQCAVTVELFAYRNTQMWIEGIKDTHNGVINPDVDYQAMIFQDITLVIEPAGQRH